MDPIWLALPGLFIWASILLLPWRPWSTQESLEAGPDANSDLSQVTVLIPARNEQETIGYTLTALAKQGHNLKIVLVDDQSTDNTVAFAEKQGLQNLTIVKGKALEPGWTGKLWTLEQGRTRIVTDFILLLDADIELKPGTINALLTKLKDDDLQLASVMAFLRMETLWETMLMPAFIYFFKLLYPFQLSNSNSRLVAAAAGGCILLKKQTLDEIGGFTALKNELIDDCALARQVKLKGHRTWIGLTHSAVSLRSYDTFQSIWKMVARTAFTQLKYSSLLLGLCTLLLLVSFLLPVAALLSLDPVTMILSFISIVFMAGSYIPTLRYYDLNYLWCLALPMIGILYLLMTWSSAIQHWRGTGSLWKNRTYTRETN